MRREYRPGRSPRVCGLAHSSSRTGGEKCALLMKGDLSYVDQLVSARDSSEVGRRHTATVRVSSMSMCGCVRGCEGVRVRPVDLEGSRAPTVSLLLQPWLVHRIRGVN